MGTGIPIFRQVEVTIDDEDMTPMHMTMFGAWHGGLGGQ